MRLHRFTMMFMIAVGRGLVVAGVLAMAERFLVDPNVASATMIALFYGGGLIGMGLTLARMGKLGLTGGPGRAG